MSLFADRFADVAIPRLMDHFGKRGGDGSYLPVSVTLPGVAAPMELTPAIVSELTERYIERDGRLEPRETCTIRCDSTALAGLPTPLPMEAEVVVPGYGDTPFNVDPELSEYGGSMTKVSLVRIPLKKYVDYRQSRTT